MRTIRQCNSCAIPFSGILVSGCIAFGCGDPDETVTLEPGDLLAQYTELRATGEPIVPEPELICARDEAREATDEERPFGEAYYPLAVDAELAEFPELARTVGFSHLENCEQARIWTELRGPIVDGHPDKPIDLTPGDPGEDAVEDKILAGTWHTDNSVLGILKLGIDGVGTCSSVVIGPRLLLTSAHCVAANTTVCSGASGSYACNKDETFEVRRATAYNPSTGTVYTTYGPVSITTFKNENYGGSGDRSDDLALLYLENLTLPSSYARPIDLNLPLGWFYASGWGRTSNSGASDSGIGLRKPNGDAKFDVDWWPGGMLYIEDNGDADVNVCKGDSGSPAVSFNGVVGILSGHGGSGVNCRINSGDPEWWTTLYAKISWIEQRIRVMGQCPQASGTCCIRNSNNTQATCF